MRPFQHLEQQALLDMLAYVTARYTKMFGNGFTRQDYFACRELLHLLQSELHARVQQNKVSRSNPGDKDFTSPYID